MIIDIILSLLFSRKASALVIPSLRSGQALSPEGAKDLLLTSFASRAPPKRKSRSFAPRAVARFAQDDNVWLLLAKKEREVTVVRSVGGTNAPLSPSRSDYVLQSTRACALAPTL